jgi:ribosome-binding protein aMBF1 (putative translation factor)
MKPNKRKRLEKRGWAVSGTQEFLGLSDEENAIIEVRLDLAKRLRTMRQEGGVSQVELARRIGSSQSRVAKMEAGDASVSIELLLRALFQLGASRRELGRVIGRRVDPPSEAR